MGTRPLSSELQTRQLMGAKTVQGVRAAGATYL
jgi:hypothetical protein